MPNLDEAVRDFLALRRIAVAGISRSGTNPGNAIYTKLRNAGYSVFAVNPNATEIEGDACYSDLRSIPGGVEGVVITTRPSVTEGVVAEAAAVGVRAIWIHRAFGRGCLSNGAVRLCRDRGIAVIAGACPMMYVPPVDIAHACFRWILKVTGGLPRR
jgi:hypothetical protein